MKKTFYIRRIGLEYVVRCKGIPDAFVSSEKDARIYIGGVMKGIISMGGHDCFDIVKES